MDREQEQMQFLGLFGIFKESYKTIISWRKIFTQITLTLILPLTFIFLAQIEISNLLVQDIEHTEFEKEDTQRFTKRYDNLSDKISSEWTTFILFKVAYIIVFLILSLLSTAAVVYTIASVYTGRELTFKKVISVVPKVWKKLIVTFLCKFTAFFIYNFFAILFMYICEFLVPYPFGTILFFILLVIYVVGSLYMIVCWQLASVVSVLESSYGFSAMAKSNNLIKGNKMVAVTILFLLSLSFILINILFELLVVHGSLEVWKRVGLGALCFILLLIANLFELVIHTILYLVCKSYHHENIDKGDLSNHLESYLGEYAPLSGKDIQLEQYEV
ncbi:hypothetical protein HanRHA438_Chr05g0244621 [Helianthus annuus]|nr:hypothetical protein HanOQP8_Chr05g0202351 [Helianthus annuus]KAJ0920737.1 hypothetical protein HanRHA438_Chr05g0244621 [Helianthus annuus]KAJ0924348.1 hypothetical protein HanPSC8_Chr05g0227141 [Helianthus annuus]